LLLLLLLITITTTITTIITIITSATLHYYTTYHLPPRQTKDVRVHGYANQGKPSDVSLSVSLPVRGPLLENMRPSWQQSPRTVVGRNNSVKTRTVTPQAKTTTSLPTMAPMTRMSQEYSSWNATSLSCPDWPPLGPSELK
jgi:hypothetical protein